MKHLVDYHFEIDNLAAMISRKLIFRELASEQALRWKNK